MRFSQVFLPILPVPNSRMFLSETASIFWMIYCTEAKATEVAPVDIFVSVLMRLLACITALTSRSEKPLTSPNFLER